MWVLFFVAKIAAKLAQMTDVEILTTDAINFVAFSYLLIKKGFLNLYVII